MGLLNIHVSNDLTVGLSTEANARGVSIDELAEVLLRSIIQDRLFDAVIDDENRLPRRQNTGGRSGPRMSLPQRKTRVLQTIDESEAGEIAIQKLGGYYHLWTKPIKALLREGKIKVERRSGTGNYVRSYYSRVKS